MTKIYFVITFLILLVITLRAQNVPVDFHTGQPIINIPIYNIDATDVSLPVSLFYEAGVKAYQQNGNDEYNIGIGWRLNAGGNITRTVRSLPDDFQGVNGDTRIGWLYGTVASNIYNFMPQNRTNCTGDASNYNFLSGLAANKTDSEPDVFSFDFNGYRGQFVYDNNHVLQIMPYQDLKIQPSYAADGSITSFKIITNEGVKYTFLATTKVTVSVTPVGASNAVLYKRDNLMKYAQQISYTTQWALSSVISKTGRTIYLNYQNIDESGTQITYSNIYLANLVNTVYKRSLYTTAIKETHQKLLSISTEDCSLNLSYRTGFDRLDNFIVKIKGLTVLMVSLNYNYANSRTYLQSVQTSNSCLKNPPYLFDYLGTDLTVGTSILPSPTIGSMPCNGCQLQQQYQQDYWGYYNNNKSSTLVPNLWVYPNEPASERYRLEQIPGYSGPNYYLAGGADRRPNPDVVAAGSLGRIRFPSGGSVLLSYESNQFYDSKADQILNGGGIRVKSVTVHDGISNQNDMVRTYTYSGGILINRPQFAFSIPIYTDPSGNSSTSEQYTDQATKIANFTARSEFDMNSYSFDSPNVEYQLVQEVQFGKGKIVYEYNNPTTYGQISSSENIGTEPWQATYSRYATTVNPVTQACMSQGLLNDGYYSFPYPDNSNYNFSRGLLKSIKSYNENGQLIKETGYDYTLVFKNSAPDIIYGLSYNYFTYNSNDINTKAFIYGKYKLYGNTNKFQTKVFNKVYDPGTNYLKPASTETNNYYTGVNHSLLSYSSTSISSDGVNFTNYKSKYSYPEDYVTINPGDSTVRALQALKDAHVNNVIIEKVNTMTKPGQSEQLLNAELNLFNSYTNVVNIPNVFLSKQMVIKANVPLTDFHPVIVESAAIFHCDSRYKLMNNYFEYGDYGEVNSVTDNQNNRTGLLYDYARSLVIAKVRNGFANQVVYSNFDEEKGGVGGWTTNSFKYIFNSPSDFSSVDGRIGKALSVGANFTFQKLGIAKGIGANCTFSCWAKSNTSGYLLITLTDASGHNVTQVITFTNTTGVWTNYKIAIPVEILNAKFDISVRTNTAVTVDDMLLHPQMASVSLTSYQDLLNLATTDPHGNTTFYSYDALRRPTLVMDQNQNILKRTAYNYNINYELSAAFSYPIKLYANSSIIFQSGPADGCEPVGIIRDWNFGDGTVMQNGGATPSHSYAATGNYTVTLTVHNAQYGTVTSQQQIYVEPPLEPALKFTLTACGIVAFEVCSKRAVFYGNSNTGQCSEYPVGTNVFTANIQQPCSSNVGFTWQMAYDNAPNTWISLQGGQSLTVNVPLDPDGSVSSNKSYTLKCAMFGIGCNAQSATQTYHINYFAADCNR
ncbi:PKD domain-containing protein [Arcticibacter eurypsychrophilus]|uniref:PKD domain-containing protein n=1 Tax=Arcticibacter eurypsychrophilus TaxID=1434752 RepID=UPI00084D432A|nr:PKD domain-containing protein [Arcticibacter eurypsychrophilus]